MTTKLSRDTASRILREAGLRQTAPRLATLQEIATLSAPVSHGELVERMAVFDYDAATIYRCLNDLADAGILSRMQLGDRTFRFEFREQTPEIPVTGALHPHFLCVQCGRILCLEHRDILSADERRRIKARVGEVTEILVKGVCHPCRERQSARVAPRPLKAVADADR